MLNHYGISRKLIISTKKQQERSDEMLKRLPRRFAAIVSDAGTPG